MKKSSLFFANKILAAGGISMRREAILNNDFILALKLPILVDFIVGLIYKMLCSLK